MNGPLKIALSKRDLHQLEELSRKHDYADAVFDVINEAESQDSAESGEIIYDVGSKREDAHPFMKFAAKVNGGKWEGASDRLSMKFRGLVKSFADGTADA